MAQSHDGDDFVRRLWHDDGERSCAEGGETVAFVGGKFDGPREDAVGREKRSETLEQIEIHFLRPLCMTLSLNQPASNHAFAGNVGIQTDKTLPLSSIYSKKAAHHQTRFGLQFC